MGVNDECLFVSFCTMITDDLITICLPKGPFFSDSSITTQPERYLIVVTSGGLNQQRTGVRCFSGCLLGQLESHAWI